jgi:predicted peptidase
MWFSLCAGQPAAGQALAEQVAGDVVGDELKQNEPEFVRLRADQAFLDLFQERNLVYTGGGYRERVFRYRLFVPETNPLTPGASPARGEGERRWPMIIWLHGKGTAGEDNLSQLRHLSGIFEPPWDRSRYPLFVLAPQCPRDNPLWTGGGAEADDMLNVVWAMVQEIVRELPVDEERISVCGVSSGGSGCWEMALRWPEALAAIAPTGSSGADLARIGRLVRVPVWAFHSTYDPGTPVEGVRRTVAALKEAGGIVHLTEVDTQSHDCWSAAFNEHELLSWLLSQQRGKAQRPPGSLSLGGRVRGLWRSLMADWTPAQLAAQIGLPLLILLAVWSVRRKRQAAMILADERESEAQP